MSSKNETPKNETPEAVPASINTDAIKSAVIANAHPAANLFPMMSGDEFNNLVLSVEQYGFDPSKPIKKNSAGKITDGRNREAAVQVVNAKIGLWNADPKNADKQKSPVVAVYETEPSDNDASILQTVLIDNFTRRHMSASQKAAVLVKAGILGGAYQRKEELGAQGKKVAGDIAMLIASQHNVNHDYIYKVKTIAKTKDVGRKLIEAIASGEMSVMQAWAQIQKIGDGTPKEGDDSGETPADAVLDGTKKPVGDEWKDTFKVREKFAAVAKLLRDARKLCDEIAASEGGQLLADGNNLKEAKAGIGQTAKALRNCEPHIVCAHCDGSGKHPEKGDKHLCPVCAGLGFLTEPQHERFVKHGVMEETPTETAEPATETKTDAKPEGKGKKGKKVKAEKPTETVSEPAAEGDAETAETTTAEGEPAAEGETEPAAV